MKTIWDRIHVWLAAKAPNVLESLQPGATEEAIRAAEAEIGVALPDEVRACYRIHDGQGAADPWEPPGFLYGWAWNSLAEMVDDWRMHKELLEAGSFGENEGCSNDPIRALWYHTAWIPITNSTFGYCHCLDLAPESGGHVGQVITWCHDVPTRYLQARSFGEWLIRFARELEAGEWTTSPEVWGPGLIRVRDL
jgi:cell wall assembly regulator SMI1